MFRSVGQASVVMFGLVKQHIKLVFEAATVLEEKKSGFKLKANLPLSFTVLKLLDGISKHVLYWSTE